MRFKTLKKVLWTLNTFLVLGMVLFVVFGFLRADRGASTIQGDKILGMSGRGGARPELERSGPGPFLEYRYIHELPVSGLPPPPPEPEIGTEEPQDVPPLAQTYELLWVAADPRPEGAWAHLQRRGGDQTIFVHGGQVLDRVWQLVAVRPYEAEFMQLETGDKVTLVQERTEPVDLSNPTAGTGGGDGGGLIGTGEVPSYEDGPARLPIEVSKDVYVIPPETGSWYAKYADRIAEGIAVDPVSDPDTGEPIGLRVKSLDKGSILRRHGIAAGDILISVNGIPMSTRAEIKRYLEGPGKGLTKYTAEIQRRGRVIKKTYNVPSNRR